MDLTISPNPADPLITVKVIDGGLDLVVDFTTDDALAMAGELREFARYDPDGSYTLGLRSPEGRTAGLQLTSDAARTVATHLEKAVKVVEHRERTSG